MKKIFKKIFNDKAVHYIDKMLFKLIFILLIPYLFLSGGFSRIGRYYKYVADMVNGRTPKEYKF